ncbi:hypothetical protein Naga_101376g1 [Nannochloropsis gaditana]|uniref:Uncharacterized protein n=1 Tax=Nannochloropsis gaditana TaxID=72520 RepID=W7T3Y5_9STRA|nr:hypothetical protein Naga_101376g1 [Nannochloropsis gaditana]
MRPHPSDPNKTLLVTLTHINPGGSIDSKAGALMVNKLSSTSPVSFVRKIEFAARKGWDEMEEGREGWRGRWVERVMWRDRERVMRSHDRQIGDPGKVKKILGVEPVEKRRTEMQSLEWERLMTVV